MKKISLIILIFLITLLQNNAIAQKVKKQLVDYVDNNIGVLDEESNCVIGPQLPFGSINPSPQTKNGGDDGYDPREPIRGFGQLHVSGTGYGTNGQIFLSPQIGLNVGEAAHDSPKSMEMATPYHYGVMLDRYHIQVGVTPSYHSALYHFVFPKSDSSSILLDITHNLPMDIKPSIGGKVFEGRVEIDKISKTLLTGYADYAGGFAYGRYRIYFAAEWTKKPQEAGTWLNGIKNSGKLSQQLLQQNDRVGCFLKFATAPNESVYLKIAVSYLSIEKAKYWLASELPQWDEPKAILAARTAWNHQFSKITVDGQNERDKTIFYTALYHAHLMPRNRTNDTRNFEKDVPMWDDHFAVWDTWRTVYPLHLLIDPDMVAGTVNSFIARFKKNGIVRDAFINGNDMDMEQGGNNVDNIIADAYLKKVEGVDWNEAYKVLKYDADKQRLGSYVWRRQDSLNNTYKTTGWIPAGIMSNSMTLEYAYNDFCTAQVARGLGKTDDFIRYAKRSHQWVNLWNKDAESDGFKGFIMPKRLNGEFVSLDAKKYPGSWKDYFYESASWTYSWFMPHDFPKLVDLNGGKEMFAKKLQYGLEYNLIEYDNEPAFLAVQGFQYAGRNDLSSYWVRKLMRDRFTEKGVPGNDDSGAMSAWYVFSALGFFPNAGQNTYYFTGPVFKKAVIHMGNGKLLTILAPQASVQNIYINQIHVNGKKWNSTMIDYDTLSQGAVILFDMGGTPLQKK